MPSSVLSELFPARAPAEEPATPKTPSRAPGFGGGPTGLGTSAAQLASTVRGAPTAEAQMTVNAVAARVVAGPTGLGTSGLIKSGSVTPSVPVVPEPRGRRRDAGTVLPGPGPR